MAFKTDAERSTSLDWLKWLVVTILFIAGLVANYYYNYQPWPYRLLAWMVLLAVMIAIILQTGKGRQTLEFVRESRIELRKVFWPTRQETVQTTLVVGAMVVVLALLLWGIDGVLVWLIGWLTGQRG